MINERGNEKGGRRGGGGDLRGGGHTIKDMEIKLNMKKIFSP